jgi:hypothetical protein
MKVIVLKTTGKNVQVAAFQLLRLTGLMSLTFYKLK